MSTRLSESEAVQQPYTAMNMRERVAYFLGLSSRHTIRRDVAWKAAELVCAEPVKVFEG